MGQKYFLKYSLNDVEPSAQILEILRTTLNRLNQERLTSLTINVPRRTMHSKFVRPACFSSRTALERKILAILASWERLMRCGARYQRALDNYSLELGHFAVYVCKAWEVHRDDLQYWATAELASSIAEVKHLVGSARQLVTAATSDTNTTNFASDVYQAQQDLHCLVNELEGCSPGNLPPLCPLLTRKVCLDAIKRSAASEPAEEEDAASISELALSPPADPVVEVEEYVTDGAEDQM